MKLKNVYIFIILLSVLSCQKEEPCDQRTNLELYTGIVGKWKIEYVLKYGLSIENQKLYPEDIELGIMKEGYIYFMVDNKITNMECVNARATNGTILDPGNTYKITSLIDDERYLTCDVIYNSSNDYLIVKPIRFLLPYVDEKDIFYTYFFKKM